MQLKRASNTKKDTNWHNGNGGQCGEAVRESGRKWERGIEEGEGVWAGGEAKG